MAPGFYAVRAGRAPGVYRTWDECSAQVMGFSGGEYKKFATVEEASAYVGVRRALMPASRAPAASFKRSRSPSPPDAPESAPAKRTAEPTPDPSGVMPAGPRPAAPKREPCYTVAEAVRRARTHLVPPSLGGPPAPLVVYTDGGCTGLGTALAQAGIGIYFGANSACNVAAPVEGRVHTNQVAELQAVLGALRITAHFGGPADQVLVRTDSTYTINVCTVWYASWKSKGFRTAAGDPVKNLDLVHALHDALFPRGKRPRNVRFEHVRGHSGEPGNAAADALATEGLSRCF